MRIIRFLAAGFIALARVNAGVSCDDGSDPAPSPTDTVFVYVGTYTRSEPWVNGTGQGVHVLRLNTSDGSLTPTTVVSVGANPTFITGTNDKSRPLMYIVNESNEPSTIKPGVLTGRVYALEADPATGALTELNSMETGGNYSMHVSLSPSHDYVAVSNYFGGSVSLFPLESSGALKPASDFHQYSGGSHVKPVYGPERQEGPHLHSMTWVGSGSPGVFAADLGNDRIVQFHFDEAAGKVTADPDSDFIARPLGSGPRHMVIHPSKKFAYCTEELSNTIAVYGLDAAAGRLTSKVIQSASSLPNDFAGYSAAADIHVSADGKFLYVSNRGHDSIAIFKINADGTIEVVGFESTRGNTPRAFQLHNQYLVVANQDSNSVQVFSVDESTGLLTYTGHSATVGTPVGLFIPNYE